MKNKIEIVVPVSGGKDSQACMKLAIEEYGADSVVGLFCDTGFEHPLTYEHIETIKGLYGVDVQVARGGTVEEMVVKYGQFPDPLTRFCTSELKIVPSKKWYKAFAEKNGGFEVWLGMRSAESNDRKKRYSENVSEDLYAPHDINAKYPKYLEKMGVAFRLPILDWAVEDVFDYLGGTENPLYAKGSDRVGCFPCLASGKKSIANALNMDEFGASQRIVIQKLEDIIGKKHERAATDQICMFCQI